MHKITTPNFRKLLLVLALIVTIIFGVFLTNKKGLGQVNPSNWQQLTDNNLGVSIPYPGQWYELDVSALNGFNGHCFGSKPGEFYENRPSYCIEYGPIVFMTDESGFWGTGHSRSSGRLATEPANRTTLLARQGFSM